MNSAMWMRITALVLFLAGLTMFSNAVLNLGISSGVKGAFSAVHLIAALALVALFEISAGRKRRASGAATNPIAMIGRIVLTVTLALGLYILLGNVLNFIEGGAYKTLIWIHAPLGIISIGLAEMALAVLGRKTR